MVARSMKGLDPSAERLPKLEGIADSVRRILMERLRLPPQAVGGLDWDTPLLGRGVGLDSVEAMALVTALEQEFAVEFQDEELTPSLFASLRSLVQAVTDKVATKDSRGDA